MKEVVEHIEGRTALPVRCVEVPEDVDVRAIRFTLGCRKRHSHGAIP
jgi:hypothetical protein